MSSKLALEKALTPSEEAAVLQEADKRLYSDDWRTRRGGILTWCALTLGNRGCELAALRWSDFDWSTGLVRVFRAKQGCGGTAKPWRTDWIPMPLALIQRLMGLQDGGGAVFRGASVCTLRRDWQAVLKTAGVRERGLHAGRHTVGTRIGLATKDPFAVRDRLGHNDRSIGVSAQYVNRNPQALRELADTIWGRYASESCVAAVGQ